MADTQFYRRRLLSLKTDRSNIEGIWDQIDRFILPLGGAQRVTEGANESGIRWGRQEVWDITAIDGAQKLAASIHGSVTSPAIRWFRLTFRDKNLAEDQEASTWLDKVGDIAFDALQDSDFNTEVASAYLDLVAACTMVNVVEAKGDGTKWKGLDFTAVPVREAYFEEDSEGGVFRFYRSLEWTPVQIVEKFEDAKTPVPEHVAQKALLPEGGITKLKVCFVIYEREGEQYEANEKKFPLLPELRPYGSCYFLEDTGEQLGDEGGYYEMPVFVTPWERTTGSRWGHGPGITALPTVKYLNAMMELTKGAIALAVDPPLAATEYGLMSDMHREPGGITVVRSKEDIFPLNGTIQARPDLGLKDIADLREQVRRLFHVDELQLKDSPAMTATEVQVRYELMNRVMGSTLARIQSSFLSKMIQCVVGILFRSGQLPPMPAQVKKSGGATTIEYQGPLSRAQRTDEVAAIERLAAYVAGLAKLFPEVSDIFDPNQAVRNIAKRLGVPSDTLASDAELAKKRKAREAAQRAMVQAEVQRAQGEAAQQQADAMRAAQEVNQGQPVPTPPPGIVSPPIGGGLPA
jgi:hypothetical protein